MKYGDKTDYPKIDIFVIQEDGNWLYKCSTNWAKSLKEAKEQFSKQSNIALEKIKTKFSS